MQSLVTLFHIFDLSRFSDAHKNLRKSERTIKELAYRRDEDVKNQQRMEGLVDQLQGKIKSYKKQIEEAEEIAALNLAKYRQVRKHSFLFVYMFVYMQVQTHLGESAERADICEQALARAKASGRSSSLAPL